MTTKGPNILVVLIALGILTAVASPGAASQATTTADGPAAVVRGYVEARNAATRTGDTAGIDRFVAADYVEHQDEATAVQGRAGLTQRMDALLVGFSDVRLDVDQMVAEVDTVAVRYLVRGTHDGEFRGIPPTGVAVSVASMDIYRVADDRIVEHWGVTDNLGLLTQLGVLPAPGAAAS